jgi:hypothetical protein
VVGTSGEIVVGYFGFGPPHAFPTGLTTAMMLIFAFGLIFIGIGTSRINRLGIFREGLAPPMKALANLLDEPYVIPWRSIKSLVISPKRGHDNPPASYSVTIGMQDGRRIRFGNDAVGWRFGSESRARQLYSLMALLTSEDGTPHPERLETHSSLIQSITATAWPERGAYRPTRALRVGTAVGGVVALTTGGLLATGWQQDVAIVRGVFALSGFVSLWALMTPNWLRRKTRNAP